MAGELRRGKRWEEEMYWTHFHTLCFCQILFDGFEEQLAIPKKFTDNLRVKFPERVTLKGPSGAEWEVGIVTVQDTLFLKQGWKKFVQDNSLQKEDVLIFKFNGNPCLDVSIFDGSNYCEREISYFIPKCEHIEAGGRSRGKRIVRESSVETSNADDDDYSPGLNEGVTSAKRSRKASKAGRKSGTPETRETRPLHPLQFASNRRPVTQEEIATAINKAQAAATPDSFTVVMRPSSVYRCFYMTIPSEWVTSHLPHKPLEAILRVGEKTWTAKFAYRGRSGGLTGGWKDFAIDNQLEESDVCLLKLVSEPSDAVVFDVTIFRVVEETTPLTRLNAPSATPGKKKK